MAPPDAYRSGGVDVAVAFAQRAGTAVVASAGNDGFDATRQTTDPVRTGHPVGPGCAITPAGLPGVVAVSATGPTGALASYSSWGADYVDITAPGGDRPAGGIGQTRADQTGGETFTLLTPPRD